MANANVPIIVKLSTDLLVGALIRANTGGDATKEAARAQTVVSINAALAQINSGDLTDGLAALQAVISGSSALDPSEAAAVQTILGFVTNQAVTINAFLGQTIAGSLLSQLVSDVLTEGTAVAQKYIPASK